MIWKLKYTKRWKANGIEERHSLACHSGGILFRTSTMLEMKKIPAE